MFFVLGLILALGAGALVFMVLQQQEVALAERMTSQYSPPPTMKLPVASRPLEVGVTIGVEDYVMKDFPLDLVPISAITETAKLDNQFLVSSVGQGETFHTNQFLGSQGATISQQIPAGKVLFAFPIVDLMSRSDLIRDGDRVDLMLTMPIKSADGQPANAGNTATGYTLQNIEVFKVLKTATDEQKQVGDATALLCSVTAQDAVIIKSVKDSGGTIDFTLRSPADKEPYTAPPINQVDLSNKYNLK
jgi:pilus assembly protein CpaB